MKGVYVTNLDIRLMREMRAVGAKREEIAQRVGCSVESVRRYAPPTFVPPADQPRSGLSRAVREELLFRDCNRVLGREAYR